MIYVITHKSVTRYENQFYKYLLVGAISKNPDEYPGYLYDSYGDNMSKRNNNYCELTGQYWIWKNCEDGIKGLVHYRRFFTGNRFSISSKFFYSENDFLKLLEHSQVVVAEREYVDEQNNYENYSTNHVKGDWDTLRNLIKFDFPDYFAAFTAMEKSNWFYPYNMIVAKRKIFDAYSKWLFDLFKRLEPKLDITTYDVQQARIYGFMSERLLRVWLETNHVKAIEKPVIQLDCRFRYRVRRLLEYIFNKRIGSGA